MKNIENTSSNLNEVKSKAREAIENGDVTSLEKILDDLNDIRIQDIIFGGRDNTLLHYACGAGCKNIEVVELLLKHDRTAVLLNTPNNEGETPLFYATHNYNLGNDKAKYMQVIALLIKHGADDKTLNQNYEDCFHVLNEKDAKDIRDFISQVQAEETIIDGHSVKDIKNGTNNPNSLVAKPDGQTETMLNMSLRNWPENKVLFNILISSDKLDVEAVGSDGVKALELAKDLGNEYAMVCLAKKGAKPTFICSPEINTLLNLICKLSAFAPLDLLASTAAVGSDAKPVVAVSSSSTAAAALSSSTSKSMGQQSAFQQK